MKMTTKKPNSLDSANKVGSAMNEDQLAEKKMNAVLAYAAKQLKVEESDLQAWFTTFTQAPVIAKLSALRLMTKHQLDPFCDEVSLIQLPTGQWYPFITIDGWTKLINQHTAFSGICFSESPQLIDGIPIWMECTIYRTDRTYPITVREYFSEVVTEYASWKTMPRRMLRHRALQQSARLAFGISGGSALEAASLTQTISNKGNLASAKEHATFLQANSPSESVVQKVAVPKRIDQLKVIMGQRE